MIVSLPTEEETHPGFPERQGREGRATTYREDPREYIAISVLRFGVAVVVTADDEPDQATIYQETFPIASEVAEEFLAWVRAGANQPWLPARHEGVRRDGIPALINVETGAVAEPRLSWNPPLRVLGIPDEAAASATQLGEIFDHLASGDSPTTAETLLSNARAALSRRPRRTPGITIGQTRHMPFCLQPSPARFRSSPLCATARRPRCGPSSTSSSTAPET